MLKPSDFTCHTASGDTAKLMMVVLLDIIWQSVQRNFPIYKHKARKIIIQARSFSYASHCIANSFVLLKLSEQDSPTGNPEAERTEFADWTYRGVLHEVIANSSVFPVLSKVGTPIDNIIASFMR